MGSYISHIGTASPEHKFYQNNILDYILEHGNYDFTDIRKLKTIYRASGIESRYSVLPDFGRETSQNFLFLNGTKPGLSNRMNVYKQNALKLAVEAVEDALITKDLAKVTHLITVSCTGMYAPGLDIDLVNALNLPKTTARACVNFMGCYGVFNAIRLADAICQADNNNLVLIVSVELCTLHYDNKPSLDQILANALFADGAAAALVSGKKIADRALEIVNAHTEIFAEHEDQMAWNIGDHAFEMILSDKLSSRIKKQIPDFVGELLKKEKLKLVDINYAAIHPGGKKILMDIEKELLLQKEHTKYSHEVLTEFGNMSSATILFVLKKIAKQLDFTSQEQILAMAFGPGITIEGMLLKSIGNK